MRMRIPTKSNSNPQTKRYFALMLFLSVLLSAGCVTFTTDADNGTEVVEENPKHSFTVGSNPSVDVTGFNGEIEIITGADNEIKVDAVLKHANRIEFSATEFENTVTVIAKRTGSGFTFGRSPHTRIHLVVPINTSIKAQTSNGPVSVTGVTGTGEIKTSNGNISLVDVTGTYVVSTSNGPMKFEGFSGQINAESSNGRVEFLGTLDAESDNRLSSSNGSITVVFEDEPNVAVNARTSNGTVETERPILMTTSEKSRLVGEYGEGSAQLELRTSNGSINIR